MQTQPNQPQASRGLAGTPRYSTLSSALLSYKPKAGPSAPTLQIRHSLDTKTHFPATTSVEFVEFSGLIPTPTTTRIIRTTLAIPTRHSGGGRNPEAAHGKPSLSKSSPSFADRFTFFSEIPTKKCATATTRLKCPTALISHPFVLSAGNFYPFVPKSKDPHPQWPNMSGNERK